MFNHRLRLLFGLALGAALVGCGGGELASELSMRPRPLPLPSGQRAVLDVPADKPFSIALAPSSETPGLEGTAEADSHADAAGRADARVKARRSGKASAEFQLGCSLKNDADYQVEMTVRARCAYTATLTLSPPRSSPDAQLVLRLYARDYANRLVRKDQLFLDTSEDGGGTAEGTVDVTFTHILGPGEAIDIFFAGAATADVKEGRSVEGSLELRDARMAITTERARDLTP